MFPVIKFHCHWLQWVPCCYHLIFTYFIKVLMKIFIVKRHSGKFNALAHSLFGLMWILLAIINTEWKVSRTSTSALAYVGQILGTDFLCHIIKYIPLQSSQSAPACWNQWLSHWKTTWRRGSEMNHWTPRMATQGSGLLWHPNSMEEQWSWSAL